jgi:hypothetical protein
MKIEPVEKDKHIYKVGIGADTRRVIAPNAKAAALFYALHGIDPNTNNPFMVAVYEQDDEPYTGEAMPWAYLAFSGSQSAALAALEAIKPDLARSRFTLDLDELREAMKGLTEADIEAVVQDVARRVGVVVAEKEA